MPRQARIDYPGAYHHIMCRGFKKELLFEDERDYNYYLDCLNFFKNLLYIIIEFCLMPNHIHLLLQTGDVPLQKILKSINTRFAVYKSKKRGLPGPIFQGRPKSILIAGQEHLTIISKYILYNPLKANLTNNLIEYEWSSYKYLNNIPKPDWFDNEIILKQFDKNITNAKQKYKKYLVSSLKDSNTDYPLKCYAGIAAGNKQIYEKILKDYEKDKRSSGKTYTRKIDWDKRICNILLKNKIDIEYLRNNKSKKTLQIKQKIAYIMKDMQLKDSMDIMKYLAISKSALSRYVNNIRNKIKEKKLIEGEL